MKNVYHIITHPSIKTSRVNKIVMKAITGKSGVETRILYKDYPNYEIDVEREKASLLKAEMLIVQSPFYWYSTPALFKEWEDKVLQYGFAYGEGGDKLKGKRFLIVLSAFGPEEAYQHNGYNHFTVRELLSPLEQTANLCGMKFLEPLVLLGGARKTEEQIDSFKDFVTKKVEELRQ